MALVSLNVNGQSYEMACGDGEEARLRRLAEYVDEKVGQLAETAGAAGEKRLLVMASLLIADELFEAQAQISELNGDTADAQAATTLASCARRIEAIAARLADT